MFYYAHHLGGDKNKRDKYKSHKYYQDTVDFCEKYDQNSFDPNYKSYPLDFFKPFVEKNKNHTFFQLSIQLLYYYFFSFDLSNQNIFFQSFL